MFMRTLLATALVASVASVSAPALAQQQSGLVNVNVTDIAVDLNEIISKNNLSVQIPIGAVVQVPIGLAANVCGTTVALLAAAGSAAACNADSDLTNSGEAMAIARALQRQ